MTQTYAEAMERIRQQPPHMRLQAAVNMAKDDIIELESIKYQLEGHIRLIEEQIKRRRDELDLLQSIKVKPKE
jgi:hypothetical protein